jgi:hypothetical protein
MSGNPALPDATPAETRHRPVNWRQEYLHLAMSLMTACWLAPWVALTLNWLIDLPSVTALEITVVHLLTSMLLIRGMIYRRTSSGLQLVVILLLMWLAAGMTVLVVPSIARAYGGQEPLHRADLFYFDERARTPGGPLVIFWVLYLWWRGYKIGGIYTTLVRASFTMRLGILSFLWLFIVADDALREAVLPLVPIFFFFGLLSSGLARADSLNLDRSGRSATLGRGWMVSLFGIAVIVSLGGYVAALWMTGMDTGGVAAVLGIALRILLTLFFLLMAPVLMFAQLIYNFIDSILPDHSGGLANGGSGDKGTGDGLDAPWLSQTLEILGTALIVAIVLCILFALLALIWFLFIARGQRREYQDEERESLGAGEVVVGLRQSLRDSWRRLAEMLGALRQFGLGRDLFAALTIRRIYARMEHLARARGYPRSLSETPYEFRQALRQAFPGQNTDIQRITDAYVAVRYGDVPEAPAELDAVRAAWDNLSHSPDPSDSARLTGEIS